MGKLHLRNVVFPAVLLSCSIFSTLTLPFVLSDPNPVDVKLPPFFEGEIQPIFTGDNKTFTIRYIGAAIVISVGTGLLTVEVLRRMQHSTQTGNSVLQSDDDSLPNSELLSGESGDSFDWESFTPLPDLVEAFEFREVGAGSDGTSPELALSAEANSGIAVLDDQGETCRIKIPDSEQTQFALMWNGDYYRFFRVRQTQDKALAIARKLARQGEQVVVSHLEQGYAVWVRASEVAPDLVSPISL